MKNSNTLTPAARRALRARRSDLEEQVACADDRRFNLSIDIIESGADADADTLAAAVAEHQRLASTVDTLMTEIDEISRILVESLFAEL